MITLKDVIKPSNFPNVWADHQCQLLPLQDKVQLLGSIATHTISNAEKGYKIIPFLYLQSFARDPHVLLGG